MPLGVIQILNRKFGQWGGTAFAKSRIKLGQFYGDDAQRPAVRNNMMGAKQQNMLAVVQLQQADANGRRQRKIVGNAQLGCRKSANGGFLFPFWNVAQRS